MTKFTEAKLEQVFIELLEQQGYPYVVGTSIVGNDEKLSGADIHFYNKIIIENKL